MRVASVNEYFTVATVAMRLDSVTNRLCVVANDSDPDGDALTIITNGSVMGTMTNGGTYLGYYVTQTGTVVIVGEEPLLEALRSTNGLVQLILYAQPGTTNDLQSTIVLPTEQAWSAGRTIIPTNLFQHLDPVAATNRALFFRAVRP